MDKLFNKKIRTVLSDIENYTRYGAVYYDFEKRSRPIFTGAFCRLCATCVENSKTSTQCFENAKSASYQSWLRGEAYSFKCWLGLYGIIIPINPLAKDKIEGAVEIAGLFPQGAFQTNIHHIISTLNNLDPSGKISGLVSAFQGIEEVPSMNFQTFGEFMKEAVFSCALLDPKTFSLNAEIWNQQNRIAGREEDFKAISLDKEKVLAFLSLEIAKASDFGDLKILQKKINEFLSAARSTSNNLEELKSAIFVALAILRMHKARKFSFGEDTTQASNFSIEIENLSKENSQELLCLKFQQMIISKLPHPSPSRRETIKKVLHFISTKFDTAVKVEDAAFYAGASVSTVMHRLKEETGMSFSEHLSATRIKEAKRLLAYTDLSVGEIASKCGFSEQSYFSKVFLKHISMTPREFRRMLIKGSNLSS